MMHRTMIRIAAGTLLLVAVAGCDPLTRDRFDMITIDVSDKFDVEKTIGKPTQQLGDQWFYERPDRHLNVMVDFNAEGVATRKQWIDTITSEWVDSQEPGDTNTRETTRIRTVK